MAAAGACIIQSLRHPIGVRLGGYGGAYHLAAPHDQGAGSSLGVPCVYAPTVAISTDI